MKAKQQKIKIVYEDIEIIEYNFVNDYKYDNFEPKNRFIYRREKAIN